MTKKQLVKIIQEVVRIEVQKEVKQIFINEGINSLKTKRSTTLKSTAPIAKKKVRKIVKKKPVVKQYTSNDEKTALDMLKTFEY